MCDSCPTCDVCARSQPQPATIPYLLGLLLPFQVLMVGVLLVDLVGVVPAFYRGLLYGTVLTAGVLAFHTDPHVRLSGVDWRGRRWGVNR